jgi:hypothetical protein
VIYGDDNIHDAMERKKEMIYGDDNIHDAMEKIAANLIHLRAARVPKRVISRVMKEQSKLVKPKRTIPKGPEGDHLRLLKMKQDRLEAYRPPGPGDLPHPFFR